MATKIEDNKIEEYKALREEILLSLNSSMSTVTYLAGALAALAAFGVGRGELRPGVFGLLIPAATIVGIWVWMGELHRLRRASFYLSCLEPILGLKWEEWLRDPNSRSKRVFFWNHRVIYWFFALAGGGSLAYGLWSFLDCGMFYVVVSFYALLVLIGGYLIWQLERAKLFFGTGPNYGNESVDQARLETSLRDLARGAPAHPATAPAP